MGASDIHGSFPWARPCTMRALAAPATVRAWVGKDVTTHALPRPLATPGTSVYHVPVNASLSFSLFFESKDTREQVKERMIKSSGGMPGVLVSCRIMRGWVCQHKRPARQQVPRVLFTHPNDVRCMSGQRFLWALPVHSSSIRQVLRSSNGWLSTPGRWGRGK